MDCLFNPLTLSAILIGFIHTLLGPDHYLPFVALSKANKWSYKKTCFVSTICGLAHCLSSVAIGLLGIGLGIAIGKIEFLEEIRGNIASYLMIAFGLSYLTWSIKKLLKKEKHIHTHRYGNLVHTHKYTGDHIHPHPQQKQNLFWGIFIVFLFGPCEPLIPLLMYPAAQANLKSCLTVTLTFTLVTLLTMIITILLALKGLSFIKMNSLEKYSHTCASLTIILCGFAIVFGL